MMMQLLDYLSV